MSTIKMQESTSNEEVVQLRKQAANKDNCYATLENELLKKNNDLLAVKGMLNETLSKLREEADRALKLESDLNRQAEDLRSEQLNRQNLEASLTSASEKLASEEQTAKYLQMDLDSYAARMSSQHDIELKRLQHERSTLEARVRALESQSQAAKPSQLPTRLPRATTLSGVASTASEARIATLESELSRAGSELADASRSLATAQQEAAKVPRLQSDLIAADNARLRAEKIACAGKADAENAQELLKEREEELEYWRGAAAERPVDEARLEDLMKERDEAVRLKEGARRRENSLRKRIEELEASEIELAMGRQEALNDLHQLQADSPADSREVDLTIAELRSALAEREAALLTARGYATELQQMYRDTLSACEDAEARAQDLERRLQPVKPEPPLLIVSPPSSPSAPAPFLAQPEPVTRMSAEDEAIVARLLSAIERLRGERDNLRRELHFTKVEHRMADDLLRARIDATELELSRLKLSMDQRSSEHVDNVRRLQDELEAWREQFERTDAELTDRATELANKTMEMNVIRGRLREVKESREKLIASYKDSSRIAVSSLIAIQRLQSELDEAEDRLIEIRRTNDEVAITQQTLRGDLAASNARFADTTKEIEKRDLQIIAMNSKLSEFQTQVIGLENELSEAAGALNVAENRYSTQLSVLSYDGDGAEALKSQLEVLEARVLRRTEQIGMLQHDTKRLETNLRVAEETIGELSAELDTLGQERACLVDDCSQAREARDEAHRRVEELEVEIESLVNHHDELEETKMALHNAQAEVVKGITSLEAMVHLFVESVTRSRGLHSALTRTRMRLTTLEANATLAEDRHLRDFTKILGLEQALAAACTNVDEHDASIQALQREKTALQIEHTRVETELHRLATQFQYVEQQAKRSDDEVMRLKPEMERLRGEVVRLEEAALAAERDRHLRDSTEIFSLEQALAAARTDVDEHDASIEALQREKTALQIEHTRVGAELHKLATQFQYVEQQAKRSDDEVIRLKPEVERLQGEVVRLEEAALAAETDRHLRDSTEIFRLEQALAAARTDVDEHDASIEALQREKTALQIEHTRVEAELHRLATQFQYVEQQAKRSDDEVMRLKPEVERLRGEVIRLEEAAHTAGISLSFKTNQYEQRLTRLQQELQQKQSHDQCQESIAELNEKNEYLEDVLKMKAAEIEENDDRIIDALKERKRLLSKVDSLTRKVQSLQTKIAALTADPPPITNPPPLPSLRPKTPSPPTAPSMPMAGPSTQAPSRIPSSPAISRSKTPDPSRRTFLSRMATPEPHVPPLPNITHKTPDQPLPASLVDTRRQLEPARSLSYVKPASPTPLSSESRKRRVPDDFDSPAPGPAEAIVAATGSTTTPRHLRRPTSDGRSGFTPIRNSTAVPQRSMLQQSSPLKPSITPLAESTNSPRGDRTIGLGQPASVSKPPMRSWLSRNRAPSTVSAVTRSASVMAVRPGV